MKKAVSDPLLNALKKLQSLPSLSNFFLAGGTNLALRFQHRESQDIDLFCSEIIGESGFEVIVKEVQNTFGENVLNLTYPADVDDQIRFLRLFLVEDGLTIKVEIIQNMKVLNPIELFEGIRIASVKDIGLFKLMSAADRASKKDIYDLAYICEKENIVGLWSSLEEKAQRFSMKEHRTIFDQDNLPYQISDPKSLLKFDPVTYQPDKRKPVHGSDQLLLLTNSKSWHSAKYDWRKSVRELFRHLDIPFPSAHGTDI